MILKIISLSLASCLYLQNFAVPLNQCIYKNDKHIEISDETYEYDDQQYKLIASIPNKNIKLYAIESCTYPGYYNKALLKVNNDHKIYTRWKRFKKPPELHLIDINNDKVEDLIVNTDTGRFQQDLHIISLNNRADGYLFEFKVTDPLRITEENVTTKLTQRDENVLIQVKVKDKEYNFKFSKDEAGVWLDDVVFGNQVTWGIFDNKVYAFLESQVSFAGFTVGTLVIEYKFNPENESLDLYNIYFEVEDPEDLYD